MNKYKVKTAEQALVYITECNLATVVAMASKKTKSKSEYERQISIAQTAIDWIRDMEIDINENVNLRINKISTEVDGVKIWAKQFEI